jgi:hypothetical protein
MGAMPNLSASFGERYTVDPITGAATPTPARPMGDMYADPVTNRAMFRVNLLSDVAKMDETGAPERGFKYKLPPMALTALIIQALHVNGSVQPAGAPFPYAMRALGLIKVDKILAGGRGLVSDEFAVVP